MIKIVSWNVAMRHQAVNELLAMDADVALLQEVGPGVRGLLDDVGGAVEISPQEPWQPWQREDFDRWPLVVKLSDHVKVEWFKSVRPSIPLEEQDEMAVSCVGTIATARIIPVNGGEPFLTVSMYARWFAPHTTISNGWIYSDAAAHGIISDLSVFVPNYEADAPSHRILAAGDLNMDFDFGRGTDLFRLRANTVFDRMGVLGFEYMGPQHPNGRRAHPTPEHLPEDTANVVTCYTTRNSPATARLQLDHVFASRGFHNSVRTRALNGVEEWGSSDHCRILIEVED